MTSESCMDINELKQLEPHFFVEWKERVISDGMFEEEDVEKWIISQENGLEFLEALSIVEYADQDCLNNILDKYGEKNDKG